MKKLSSLFPNWKTTVTGSTFVITALTGIAGLAGEFPMIMPYVKYLLLIAAIFGVINSALQKTYNVTGGTVPNTTQDGTK